MVNYVVEIVTILVAITVAMTSTAYAYTDPGSGLLIWQLLVSLFVGGIFYFRKAIAKLREKFKNGK